MEGRWSLPYSGLGLGLGTGVIRGFADSPSRLWDAYSERARWATRERSRLNASLLIMRGVRLKFLITPFLAVLLTACATGRVVHYSPNTTAFQREVLEWMAIGNEALKTGVEPAPLNEREAAYAFNALVEEYSADRLHTGRQIALDDLALCFPTRDTTGTPGLLPLTHGNLLYTAWALGLVTTLPPEEVLLRGLSRFFRGW